MEAFTGSRFAQAAHSAGLRPIVGASTDVEGTGRIRLICKTRDGYRNLCRLMTLGHADRPKGECLVTLEQLEQYRNGLQCLAGPGLHYLSHRLAAPLVGIFNASHFALEANLHLTRQSTEHFARTKDLGAYLKVPVVATNDVRHAFARQKPLLDVMQCIEKRCTLEQAGHYLQPNAERRLKGPEEMRSLLAQEKDVLHRTISLSEEFDFSFGDTGYRFPSFPTPDGEPQFTYLKSLVWQHAVTRYPDLSLLHRRQIEKELNVIEKLDLSGYFLLVWDIVRFAKENSIMVQGRGSAANSAVCYVLGITAVDPIAMDLLLRGFSPRKEANGLISILTFPAAKSVKLLFSMFIGAMDPTVPQ